MKKEVNAKNNYQIDNIDSNISSDDIYEKVPSTAQIVYHKIAARDKLVITTEWFEWASELLKAGYTNKHIIALSHQTISDDQIKLRGLTNLIFDELDIKLDEDTIYKYYGIYTLKQNLAANKDIYDILSQLNTLFIETSFYYLFYDFHILFSAYKELKAEGEQNLWKGLNFENKEEYIKTYFYEWIKNPGSQIYNRCKNKSSLRKTIVIYMLCGKYAILVFTIFSTILLGTFYWMLYVFFPHNILSNIIIIGFAWSAILKAIFEIVKIRKKIKERN